MTASRPAAGSRLKWVLLSRLAATLLFLVHVELWGMQIHNLYPATGSYRLLILIFLFSGLSMFLLRYREHVVELAQVPFDTVVVASIVLFTGGIDSPYIFLFVLPVLEGGMIRGRRGASYASIGAVSALGCVFLIQHYRLLGSEGVLYYKTFYTTGEYLHSFSVFALGILVIGILVGFLASETVRAKERLFEEETLKDAIVESMSSCIVVCDASRTVTYRNDNARNFSALPDVQDGGDSFARIFGDEIDVVMERKMPVRGEKRITLGNGGSLWLGYSVVPLSGEHGEMSGTIVNCSDITEMKRMEEKLRINDKFAFFGQLSSFIAHEIRNPLASLKGSVDFLGRNIPLDSDNARVFDIVRREIDRLNKVIGDFQSYAKRTEPERSIVFLMNLVEEVWFELTFAHECKECFSFRYEGCRDVRIWADPNQLRQVFLNLFLNATEAAPGGCAITVRAAVEPPGTVVVEVEDTAGGIDDNVRERIFDPFFTTKQGGSGLGLPIVYRIIEEHGASIAVRSTGSGTIFSMRFEAYEAEDSHR